MTDRSDEDMVADLRRVAAEVDPVPADVTAAARAAIVTRDLDRELAVLIGDSTAYDTPEAAATRGGFEPVRAGGSEAPSRLLSFEGGGVQVDVEVIREPGGLSLMGQLTGVAPEDCALEYGDGQRQAIALDRVGRFLVSPARGGPVRLRCRATSGGRVVTDWVVL